VFFQKLKKTLGFTGRKPGQKGGLCGLCPLFPGQAGIKSEMP
jgi:hypothetical protein